MIDFLNNPQKNTYGKGNLNRSQNKVEFFQGGGFPKKPRSYTEEFSLQGQHIPRNGTWVDPAGFTQQGQFSSTQETATSRFRTKWRNHEPGDGRIRLYNTKNKKGGQTGGVVVSGGKKKEKQATRRQPVQKRTTPRPQKPQEPKVIDLDEITVLGGPDPRRVTLPQIEVNTDLPPLEYVDVPTKFTRKMVRQSLRDQGINPYDLSGVERRALRHRLNGHYDHNDAVLLNSNPMFTNSYPSEDERLYTRADIRRMAEEAGYDLSARERKALRHYLNNDYSNSDLRHLPAQPFDYDEFVR